MIGVHVRDDDAQNRKPFELGGKNRFPLRACRLGGHAAIDHRPALDHAAGAGLALAGDADLLARHDACGQFEFDGFAIAQRYPLRLQPGSVGERHQMFIGDIGAFGRRAGLRAGSALWTRAGTAAAKQPVEYVTQINPALKIKAAALPRPWPAGTERAATAETTAKGGTWLAVFVNFAAIILGTFVLVGQQIIGLRHLAETRGSSRVILIFVRMQFLCQLAIGAFDRLFVRALGNAQYGIWIGHYCPC